MKVDTGNVWVADEVVVKVGGKNYWLFNVIDSDTRFLLAAYLSPARTTRAAATALALARERADNPPRQLKTDGLASYLDAVPRAFLTHPVKHVVSKCIRAQINNNLSERLQGTIRDRDKTLRGLKARETGQIYVDDLVTHYNYFRPHMFCCRCWVAVIKSRLGEGLFIHTKGAYQRQVRQYCRAKRGLAVIFEQPSGDVF